VKHILFIVAIGFVFTACQSGAHEEHNTNNAAEKLPVTREDSLYKAVLALHDEVMPKMGKLIGYKKNLEQRIDSLTQLISKKASANQQKLREEYKELLTRVSAAEKGMNDWMEQFNPDPQLPTQSEMEKYFEDQKMKAQQMRDAIMEALDSSKSKLGM
jgi:hypothetical protein